MATLIAVNKFIFTMRSLVSWKVKKSKGVCSFVMHICVLIVLLLLSLQLFVVAWELISGICSCLIVCY